ncbi:hypothetical protein CP97_14737 [Aurantiacibacter atlanticus]|uniref:Uncharacterized protein n=1 Tax=Aurantiacibacter atlanticus TaxID=1648404 RepID=A0A168M1P2_9SPHN|nr:hypothetical protein CP97_14737 [Aurantiacibacter atlanticus]
MRRASLLVGHEIPISISNQIVSGAITCSVAWQVLGKLVI